MHPFLVYIATDHDQEFQAFVMAHIRVYKKYEKISLPSGDFIYVIIPGNPYDRLEVEKLGYVEILPHAFTPGTIGKKHVKKFAHVGAHENMTPYELRKALHEHPAHPHPMFNPEW